MSDRLSREEGGWVRYERGPFDWQQGWSHRHNLNTTFGGLAPSKNAAIGLLRKDLDACGNHHYTM